MKNNKILKYFLLMTMVSILSFPISVYADDSGWPVDDGTAQDETITDDTKDSSSVEGEVADELTNENSGATDDYTGETEDYEIFGDDYSTTGAINNSQASDDDSLSMSEKIYSNYSDVIPVVTTNQMVEWILKKGNELISILQIVAQPFSILIFIIGAAITLIGTLTKGNMAGKGIICMVTSVVIYCCVLYAPLLVNTLVGWAAS